MSENTNTINGLDAWHKAVEATSQHPALQAIAINHYESAVVHHTAKHVNALRKIGSEAVETVEQEENYEELNRQELVGAFSTFIHDRKCGWNYPSDRIGNSLYLSSAQSLWTSCKQRGPRIPNDIIMKPIFDNDRLVERVGVEMDNEGNLKPFMTICVPVGILTEDRNRVTTLLEKIAKESNTIPKPIEVLIWANAKYDDAEKDSVILEAQRNYEDMKQEIQKLTASGNIRVYTALQHVTASEFSMSRVRKNYMDALALKAVREGYGFDHPVMWLDADTTDIKKGTLKIVADEVHSFNSAFCHPSMYYSIDWNNGNHISDSDDATKAFAIDEMARRMGIRSEVESAGDRSEPLGYLEESGFSFALGTYLVTGGINTTDDINETVGVLTNARAKVSRPIPETRKFSIGDLQEILPESLLKRKNLGNKKIDWTINLNNARIYVSGRNYYEGYKMNGRISTDRSASGISGKGIYTLFSDVAPLDGSQVEVKIEDLESSISLHIGEKENDHSNNHDNNHRIAKRLLTKYFKQKS